MSEKSSFMEKKKKLFVLKKLENLSPVKVSEVPNNIFNGIYQTKNRGLIIIFKDG